MGEFFKKHYFVGFLVLASAISEAGRLAQKALGNG